MDYDGRTTDRRTPEHDHPISAPCEPFSGMMVLRNESSTELWIAGREMHIVSYIILQFISIEHQFYFWVKLQLHFPLIYNNSLSTALLTQTDMRTSTT